MIRERAGLAVASLASATPVAITLPATMRLTFKTTDYAELASRIAGCERTGLATAELVGDDPLALYRSFITVVLLCQRLRE